jgi:hypothetical protein
VNGSMTLRKVAFSTFLLGVSLYILLPTPDELVIYPVGSFFFSYALHIPVFYALLLTMIIYRGVGAGCLLGALLIGGKPIYYNLKEKYRKRRIQPLSKRLGQI